MDIRALEHSRLKFVRYRNQIIGYFVTDRLGVCSYVSLSGVFVSSPGVWYIEEEA